MRVKLWKNCRQPEAEGKLLHSAVNLGFHGIPYHMGLVVTLVLLFANPFPKIF